MKHSVTIIRTFILALSIASLAMGCSSSHKTNGYHVSKLKEEELQAKSNFNLKQAKAIVDENSRNRPKNQRNAEKVRKQTNQAIEDNQKSQQQKAKVVQYKPKVVPSFY